MKQSPALILFIISVALLFSCKKDKQEISAIPEISLVSVSPLKIKEYSDNISFTIAYKDGDGDIGENVDGVKNLFITDSRNSITYQFRVKQLAPDGSSVAIKGNLIVELSNAAILDNSTEQTVEYSIYLKDRAGNSSNTVRTSGLSIIK